MFRIGFDKFDKSIIDKSDEIADVFNNYLV